MKRKIVTTFNIEDYEDEAEYKLSLQYRALARVIHEVGEKLFRPARKHGYSDSKLQDLIVQDDRDHIIEAIGLLEDNFYEILREVGIDYEDCF